MDYQNIDWNELWLKARQKKSYKSKKKKDWNTRAKSFAKRTADSDFSSLFIEKMNPDPAWSVLDIGCGPGTLAIPLAKKGLQVTALDSSEGMLEQLELQKQGENLTNITKVHSSWNDSWTDIGLKKHDVAIAARSLAVTDLKAGLEKLNRWATKKVFVADRVGAGPFDPDLFKAIGRDFEPGPDFIFTVNILFQMGINPTIDYLDFDQERTYTSRQDATENVAWMVDDLTDDEEAKLATYIDDRLVARGNSFVFKRRMPVKWAFIAWDVV